MEVEAKFLARTASALEAIARRRRLGAYRLSPASDERLETLYLDTSRRDLRRGRIALRIRRSGRRHELTLKLAGETAGVVHRRAETTVPLRRMPEFPFRLSGPMARRLRRWTRGRALSPLVVTRVRRRALAVRRGKTTVAELDLDQVTLDLPAGRARRRRRPGRFFEVEIELRRGTETDLARLCGMLRRRHALKVSRLSKLERALRWAGLGDRSPGRAR